jgi:hypothetical protein
MEEHGLRESENKALKRLFESKKVTGQGKLNNEEPYNLNSSANIILRVIKSRRIR